MPFAEPGIQVITLSLISVTAVLGLVSVALGLFSTLTGKDPLPKRVRSMLHRVPASAEDFRLRGLSLMLNGAAVMLMVSGLTINVAGSPLAVWSGYAPSAGPAYWIPVSADQGPKDTMFLVTAVAALAAIACFIGAYTLGVRVRYVRTGDSTGAQPGMPPA